MDRKSARTIKLDGKIEDVVCTSNGCFCYTENSVRKIRTPEEIDPDNLNMDIPFENTLYRNSGTRNYITARVVIQSKRFLDAVPTKVDKSTVLAYLMEIETNLLLCNRIFKGIKKQIIQNDKIKIRHRNGVIDKLPVIEELDIQVYQFLMSAKQVQQIVVSIFNEFHEYQGKKLDGPHINKMLEKMEAMDSENPFLKNLKANQDIYKSIVDIRNAQEHPNKNRYLTIDNFMLHSDGKLYVPSIRYFNSGLQFEADIVPWMQSVIAGLLHLVEMQMLYNVCKSTLIPQNFSLAVRSIPESEQNESCPVSKELFFIQDLPPEAGFEA